MTISEENTRYPLTIPKSLKQQLEKIADRENRSLNNLIIYAIKNYLENQK